MMVTKCIRCGRLGPPGAWWPHCPRRGIDTGGPGVPGVICDFRRVWEPNEVMHPPDTDEVIAWREEQRRKIDTRLDEACAMWGKLLNEQSSVSLQDLLKHYPTTHVQWHTHHHSLLKEAAHQGVVVHVYTSRYGSIVTCVLYGDNESTKFSSDYAGCDHMLFECQLKPLLEAIRAVNRRES